jgi:hypothetical protein
MCGWPVDALAAPAEGKLLLGGEDIRRDFSPYGLFRYRSERTVAFHATREEILKRIQATDMDYLL